MLKLHVLHILFRIGISFTQNLNSLLRSVVVDVVYSFVAATAAATVVIVVVYACVCRSV